MTPLASYGFQHYTSFEKHRVADKDVGDRGKETAR